MPWLLTIGYERATVEAFLTSLKEHNVDLLIDVRAAARSRRPGFAKTMLRENLAGAGIRYVHLPALGTPAEGRVAARAGRSFEMKRIYRQYLATAAAQDGLADLVEIVRAGHTACLLCLEAEPEDCHRSLVAEAVAAKLPVRIENLKPWEPDVRS